MISIILLYSASQSTIQQPIKQSFVNFPSNVCQFSRINTPSTSAVAGNSHIEEEESIESLRSQKQNKYFRYFINFMQIYINHLNQTVSNNSNKQPEEISKKQAGLVIQQIFSHSDKYIYNLSSLQTMILEAKNTDLFNQKEQEQNEKTNQNYKPPTIKEIIKQKLQQNSIHMIDFTFMHDNLCDLIELNINDFSQLSSSNTDIDYHINKLKKTIEITFKEQDLNLLGLLHKNINHLISLVKEDNLYYIDNIENHLLKEWLIDKMLSLYLTTKDQLFDNASIEAKQIIEMLNGRKQILNESINLTEFNNALHEIKINISNICHPTEMSTISQNLEKIDIESESQSQSQEILQNDNNPPSTTKKKGKNRGSKQQKNNKKKNTFLSQSQIIKPSPQKPANEEQNALAQSQIQLKVNQIDVINGIIQPYINLCGMKNDLLILSQSIKKSNHQFILLLNNILSNQDNEINTQLFNIRQNNQVLYKKLISIIEQNLTNYNWQTDLHTVLHNNIIENNVWQNLFGDIINRYISDYKPKVVNLINQITQESESILKNFKLLNNVNQQDYIIYDFQNSMNMYLNSLYKSITTYLDAINELREKSEMNNTYHNLMKIIENKYQNIEKLQIQQLNLTQFLHFLIYSVCFVLTQGHSVFPQTVKENAVGIIQRKITQNSMLNILFNELFDLVLHDLRQILTIKDIERYKSVLKMNITFKNSSIISELNNRPFAQFILNNFFSKKIWESSDGWQPPQQIEIQLEHAMPIIMKCIMFLQNIYFQKQQEYSKDDITQLYNKIVFLIQNVTSAHLDHFKLIVDYNFSALDPNETDKFESTIYLSIFSAFSKYLLSQNILIFKSILTFAILYLFFLKQPSQEANTNMRLNVNPILNWNFDIYTIKTATQKIKSDASKFLQDLLKSNQNNFFHYVFMANPGILCIINLIYYALNGQKSQIGTLDTFKSLENTEITHDTILYLNAALNLTYLADILSNTFGVNITSSNLNPSSLINNLLLIVSHYNQQLLQIFQQLNDNNLLNVLRPYLKQPNLQQMCKILFLKMIQLKTTKSNNVNYDLMMKKLIEVYSTQSNSNSSVSNTNIIQLNNNNKILTKETLFKEENIPVLQQFIDVLLQLCKKEISAISDQQINNYFYKTTYEFTQQLLLSKEYFTQSGQIKEKLQMFTQLLEIFFKKYINLPVQIFAYNEQILKSQPTNTNDSSSMLSLISFVTSNNSLFLDINKQIITEQFQEKLLLFTVGKFTKLQNKINQDEKLFNNELQLIKRFLTSDIQLCGTIDDLLLKKFKFLTTSQEILSIIKILIDHGINFNLDFSNFMKYYNVMYSYYLFLKLFQSGSFQRMNQEDCWNKNAGFNRYFFIYIMDLQSFLPQILIQENEFGNITFIIENVIIKQDLIKLLQYLYNLLSYNQHTESNLDRYNINTNNTNLMGVIENNLRDKTSKNKFIHIMQIIHNLIAQEVYNIDKIIEEQFQYICNDLKLNNHQLSSQNKESMIIE